MVAAMQQAQPDYFANHERARKFPWTLYHAPLERDLARFLERVATENPSGDILVVGCGLLHEIDAAPPGMPSRSFRVERDDTRVDLVRPPLRTVTGRVVVENGPLPYGWLGFLTESSYVTAHIGADGSFRAQLQPARHTVELAGMPGGYSVASVKLGSVAKCFLRNI